MNNLQAESLRKISDSTKVILFASKDVIPEVKAKVITYGPVFKCRHKNGGRKRWTNENKPKLFKNNFLIEQVRRGGQEIYDAWDR